MFNSLLKFISLTALFDQRELEIPKVMHTAEI